MKKFNKFGFASAIVLAGAMGFAACSSDDEMENINPTYDGSSVKTQFSISLTQKAKDKNGARMTNEQVGNGNFTGIKNVKLYHFNAPVTESSKIVGIVPEITAINDFNYQNTGQTKLNGNVYDIKIPTGTSYFLFYGESNLASIGSTIANYPETPAGSDVDDITFTPAKILDDATKVRNFGTAYTNIINTLNAVYAALTNNALPASVKAEATSLALLTTASSEHILALVEEIYNSVAVQGDALPAGADKTAITEALAAIVDAGFTVNGSELTWTAETNFPGAFGLPSGAVAVKFNNGQFEKNEDRSNTSDGSQGDYRMYAKPANLMYYVNSPAAVRNTSYFDMAGAASVTASEANWDAVAGNFNIGAVEATTRSVILKEQVNYGVAQLQTSVKFATGRIEDSKSTQETPNYVTIPDAGFQVTGILVGNQKQVGWDFAPIGSDVYTIYDTIKVNAIMAKQADDYSDVHYTLVYESQDATSAEDQTSDIRVALELVNGGTEFYGVGGQKVPAGATFYLVGELHVGNQYAVDAPVKSVFKQDYITTAKFTISSLKNAYNVIPDLATPQMEFGMSVNLSWQTGLNFDVTIE